MAASTTLMMLFKALYSSDHEVPSCPLVTHTSHICEENKVEHQSTILWQSSPTCYQGTSQVPKWRGGALSHAPNSILLAASNLFLELGLAWPRREDSLASTIRESHFLYTEAESPDGASPLCPCCQRLTAEDL